MYCQQINKIPQFFITNQKLIEKVKNFLEVNEAKEIPDLPRKFKAFYTLCVVRSVIIVWHFFPYHRWLFGKNKTILKSSLTHSCGISTVQRANGLDIMILKSSLAHSVGLSTIQRANELDITILKSSLSHSVGLLHSAASQRAWHYDSQKLLSS